MHTLNTAVVCFAFALLSGEALGQRALGDGKALDSNLREGSNGRNAAARNLEREFQLRNAIVTGRAAGGMSFRGDVGYGAADDFRGGLAEDDLFAFDRDSFYSGLTGQGIRGADALQFQMQMTVGGFVGEGDFLAELGIVRRAQDATSVRSLRDARELQSEYGSNDPLQFRDGSLRSTSAYISGMSQAPVLLQVIPGETEGESPRYNIASPLRSITTQESPQVERRLSDSVKNLDRLEMRLQNPMIDDRAPSTLVENSNAVYRSILERQIGELHQGDDAEPEAGDGLDGEDPDILGNQGELVPESELLERLRELREELMRPETETPEYGGSQDEDPDATEALRQQIAADAQQLFEGAPIQIDSIAPPARELDDLFSTHMRRGQEMLVEGQWFSAEERFTSALGLRPGDPMAAVGRVHAQIGGGMFLSAGLNLQKLFRAHPELINVRYGEGMLPTADRLREVEAMLLTRLQGDDDFSRGAALVQAYLGFQTQHATWTDRGLDRAREIDEARGRAPDTLLDVLDRAWSSE